VIAAPGFDPPVELRARLADQTMTDQPSEVFLCGRYHDRVAGDNGHLRFAEKICFYDSDDCSDFACLPRIGR
jgi:hypothetical protein